MAEQVPMAAPTSHRAIAKKQIRDLLQQDEVKEIALWDGPSFHDAARRIVFNGSWATMLEVFESFVDYFDDFDFILRSSEVKSFLTPQKEAR